MFTKKPCDICGNSISLFEIGRKVNGKLYCSDCFYSAFRRFKATPLPKRLENKIFSVKDSVSVWKSRCYDLCVQKSLEPFKYVFHILFIVSYSVEIKEMVGIENVTGKLYHIKHITEPCYETGPDAGSDRYKVWLSPITDMQLQILLNAVPYPDRSMFNNLTTANGKDFLNISHMHQSFL